MNNSSLVTYTNLSKHHYSTKRSPSDVCRISPHCYVAQITAKRGCDYFATTDKDASANYVVGYDGSVGLSVSEEYGAFTTSDKDNDMQAITMEIASATVHPYQMTDKAYSKAIELMIDICKRYNKKKLLWFGDKDKTLNYKPKDNEMVLTVHRWFANKSCPGDWLYNRLGEVAQKVTEELNKVDKIDLRQDKTTGLWHSYKGDKIDTSFSGLLQNSAGWWYVENGTIDFNYCGIVKNSSGEWYVDKAKVDFDKEGLFNVNCVSYSDGTRNTYYGWYYFHKGQIQRNGEYLVKLGDTWWYVNNGMVDFSYNGNYTCTIQKGKLIK